MQLVQRILVSSHWELLNMEIFMLLLLSLLLLTLFCFFERDELYIYNIPITSIINDFLEYIHKSEELNIELSSEFILFISTLMRIKARMLLPRKEIDAEGNEIDPRQELINKILEYKRFKQAALEMQQMEAMRMMMVKRGNLQNELAKIGEESGEGTE